MANISKFMCVVETKNYPINTIFPQIPRYSSIRKKFNASEIANCLAHYATVTLIKNNGSTVKLTKDNFKSVLIAYKNELEDIELSKAMRSEEVRNTQAIEEIKKEDAVINTHSVSEPFSVLEEKVIDISDIESLEVIQEDPEDPDTSDFSYIDGDDEEESTVETEVEE